MKVYLSEITDDGLEFDFTQEQSWVLEAVRRVDEQPVEGTPAQKATTRSIHAHLELRKVDEVVVLSGKIDTHLQLVCSRCALYFNYECKPQFSALFCKDPIMAGVAHFQSPGKPAGQTQGKAMHAHADNGDASYDLDITYLSEDFVDLGDVLSEQLRLQVPFQPLCDDACKGICVNCGADLNRGRCACGKIAKPSPFAPLETLKSRLKTKELES